MVTLVAALLSILVHIFSRRLPVAKPFGGAAFCFDMCEGGGWNNNISSVEAVGTAVYLVHILPADWLWRSWWRRCYRPSCLV
jgi:hypothetical protein